VWWFLRFVFLNFRALFSAGCGVQRASVDSGKGSGVPGLQRGIEKLSTEKPFILNPTSKNGEQASRGLAGKVYTPFHAFLCMRSFVFTLGFHEDFILRRLSRKAAQPCEKVLVLTASPVVGLGALSTRWWSSAEGWGSARRSSWRSTRRMRLERWLYRFDGFRAFHQPPPPVRGRSEGARLFPL